MWNERFMEEGNMRPVVIRGILAMQNLYRRILTVFVSLAGPRISYQVSAILARWFYRLFEAFRLNSEAQCRAALKDRIAPQEVGRLAEQAFIHRIWNLVDMMLAERLLHPGTYRLYGGQMDEAGRQWLLDAQRRRRPVILVTGYYGSYDLLPLFLGYNGIRATVVYQPHENPAYDRFRQRVRSRGGCELVPVAQAADRLASVLESGGTVALVADHHTEHRGLPVTFLGLPTRALRTVGLLAWRYQADIVVAGIRRLNNEFRFELVMTEFIEHHQWQHLADPVEDITHRYLRGLEKMILADPSQYLWGYPRWGKEVLRELRTNSGSLPPAV
jgi:KDO2-lipid IV(A) lauroyltransferase